MEIAKSYAVMLAPFLWTKTNCPCCGLSVVDIRLYTALIDLHRATDGQYQITSLTRCRQHNSDVSGTPNSLHLIGRAADLAPNNYDLQPLANAVLEVPAFAHGGVGLYPSRGIIHVDIRPAPARWGKVGQTFVSFDETWRALYRETPPHMPDPKTAPYSLAPEPTWR